ncbi:MAG: SIS domain-containing protein [Actinomycetota bacterium]|nr:SIS domain-containing protein [Actinomycetota bacterium]MDH5277673.1 SIS domain-containing protein [Actinomycetota bacterium]
MDAAGFLTDLERKPEVLGALAQVVERGDFAPELADPVGPVLMLGMGSSAYAAGVAAARLRSLGVVASAELASSRLHPPPDPDLTVIAISASGGSRETLDAVGPYLGRSRVVALTNEVGSPVTQGADVVWPMLAGPEVGGVACRSFQHTIVALLVLESVSTGGDVGAVAGTVRAAAAASADLLDRRADWLPEVAALLDGPDGCAVVAPAHRLSSAQQSSLMMREGPRRPAVACETGDWSHVDVYLTRTLDYRMLLFPGSPYEPELLRWTGERGSTVVSVGEETPGVAGVVRYRHDDIDDVRLLSEVLVAELVAHAWWAAT